MLTSFFTSFVPLSYSQAELILGEYFAQKFLTEELLSDANRLALSWLSHKDFGTANTAVLLGKWPESSWIESLPAYKELLEKYPRLPENRGGQRFNYLLKLVNASLEPYRLAKLNDRLTELKAKSSLTNAEKSELYLLDQMQDLVDA